MPDTELQKLAKVDRNPIEETRYQELLKQQGSFGGGSDYLSMAREQMKLMQEANQPIITSLQATIPTVAQKFTQAGEYLGKQATNLKDRYDKLLASITGMQQTDVQRTEVATSNELGRRGISAQSGLFGETVNKALLPVNRAYAGQIGEMGSVYQSGATDIENRQANLPIEQLQEEQKIQQAIASLQAGGNQSAITSALDIWRQMRAEEEAQKNRDASAALAALQNTGTGLQTQVIGDKLVNSQTGAVIADFTPTRTGGNVPTSPVPQYYSSPTTQYSYGGYSQNGQPMAPRQSLWSIVNS